MKKGRGKEGRVQKIRIATPSVLVAVALASLPGSIGAQPLPTNSGLSVTVPTMPPTPGTYAGTLPDGATYTIQMPVHFNGTLLLYSHGYVAPGASNPGDDTGDLLTGAWMVDQGFALAGSSYAGTGWAIEEAVGDQLATIDRFTALLGRPASHVVAWGHSMGGLVTLALAEEYPHRISGGLSLCGVVAGAPEQWDVDLAAMVAFRALLMPRSSLQIVDITDPQPNQDGAELALAGAQKTAAGRARIALVSALAGVPGWFAPDESPPPTASRQEAAQDLWWASTILPFVTRYRAELESRAGGNVSGDERFDFSRALHRSPQAGEVRSLYRQAHLSLSRDLTLVSAQARVAPSEGAADYIHRYFSGGEPLTVPLLSVHTTGDGLVPAFNEEALRQSIASTGSTSMLRQAMVARAGHCTFSAAETITALNVVIARVDSGRWPSTDPVVLDSSAAALGGAYERLTTFFGTWDEPAAFTRGGPPPVPG